MNKSPRLPRITNAFLLLSLLALALWGCSESYYERYTDQQMPSKESLQQIDRIDPQAFARAEPVSDEPNQPGPPPAELPVTIDQCRAWALSNNLELQAALYGPAIAEQQYNQSLASFEPLFFSNFDFVKTDTPTSLTLDASQQEYFNSNSGINVLLVTGGSVTINQPYSRVETNNQFSTLNPAYNADLSLSLTQPLLRGAGAKVATLAIRLADYDARASYASTKLSIINFLWNVDIAYWRYYAAGMVLDVRRQEHQLALEQLERARRMVNVGQSPEIEILRAENAAAERLEAIIIADNQLRDRQRELKRVLNLPDVAVASPTRLQAQTPPNIEHYIIDSEQILAYALKNRMELLELELQIARSWSAEDLQKNGTLPFLSLNYTYNVNGLGPSRSEAYNLLAENRFVDHQLGLRLEIPIGNRAATSRYLAARLQRYQNLVAKKQREQVITMEVLAAVDQLEANWQRVLAGRAARELAERTLLAEQRRFELGLQTSTEALDAQARFANAQLVEIQAIAEYQIAQVDLAFAAGGLLGAARIHWQPQKPDHAPLP